ncbi:MAG: D-Ala-D-Ala carboxypeptidase family metallohydrolase [Roseateles sp.]|uniref:D-Ala-D-Ala carboxypeptidase family metallohydrolase n=1 Tax=Roseateles sp. TaxID=1971397 RepID=UPI00403656B3
MTTQLSTHFSLAEFIRSDTAQKYRLDNTPPAEIQARLQRTAELMEAVRELLGGRSIRINSGYRGPAVNQAVGGVNSSAHTQGWAVDFVCPDFGPPYEVCRKLADSGLLFDQLIHEYGRWTHLSFAPTMRRQALSIASAAQGYVKGIVLIKTA